MQAFECGTLVNGTAAAPADDAVLLVEDGHVTGVETETAAVPTEATHVDLGAQVVVPGLMDAHLHLGGWRSMEPADWLREEPSLQAARAVADLESLLAAGFTAVRDLGSPTGLGLRQAVAEGSVPGPRVYTSGRLLTQTGGHADLHDLPLDWVTDADAAWFELVDGERECRVATRRLLRRDVDVIKIVTSGGVLWQKSAKDAPDQPQMTDAEVRAITEEAHRVGVPVASHAQGPAGVRRAVTNGVDTVEHGTVLDDETIALLVDHDVVLVPTLSTNERRIRAPETVDLPESDRSQLESVQERHVESVRAAAAAGVDVALGTDFLGTELLPHGENTLEAELLVSDVGLSEDEVLRAATGVAARTVADEATGTLTPGSYADFVALDSNPLVDITALRDVHTVYRGGIEVE